MFLNNVDVTIFLSQYDIFYGEANGLHTFFTNLPSIHGSPSKPGLSPKPWLPAEPGLPSMPQQPTVSHG